MSSVHHHHPDTKNSIENLDITSKQKQYHHVMSFGTFDIFHPGHMYYLSESAKLADTITILVARDHRVFSGKGRDPVHDESIRKKIVADRFPMAQVILGHESDIFSPLREHSPDLLAFGYDQKVPESKIKELFPGIEIVRIGGYETDKWKSSILRQEIESKSK